MFPPHQLSPQCPTRDKDAVSRAWRDGIACERPFDTTLIIPMPSQHGGERSANEKVGWSTWVRGVIIAASVTIIRRKRRIVATRVILFYAMLLLVHHNL